MQRARRFVDAPLRPTGQIADLRAEHEVMLVAAGPADEEGRHAEWSSLRMLRLIGRRSLPSVVEATIIPSALFYVCFVTVGPGAAMLATLAWSYGAALRRVLRGRRVPGVLQLALAGVTIHTAVGILSGTFMYFLQPIATTLALGVVFLGSLWLGSPLVGRLAADFCPLRDDVAARPAVVRLFSGLTIMWAGVHFVSAGTTFALLVSLPTRTFVAMRSVGSLAITTIAVVFTVAWSIRTARTEHLILAPRRLATGVP